MTTGSSNYIPRNPLKFCFWMTRFLSHVKVSHERWGIVTFDDSIEAKVVELQKLAEKCVDRDHSPIDILKRNEAWKELDRYIRGFIRGLVLNNPAVTDEDRGIMGLPIRDKVRTPVGIPGGQAVAEITYPGRTQLLLHIRHVDGTPEDPRAQHGYRIFLKVIPPGTPIPISGKELNYSRFTRLKRELFDFNQDDSCKIAVFCIRYENRKGKAGPFGPIFWAVIP